MQTRTESTGAKLGRQLAARRGRLIAGFASARDASTFAAVKRDEGEQVTVVAGRPDSPYLFEVHTLVRSL